MTRFREAPFPAWPVFEEDEIEAVSAVLRSGKVNQWTGHEVKMFEQEFAQWAGVKHAVAVANGTVAIELILHALDIGHGHEVIVPSRTFVGTASAVAVRGAKAVCADLDPVSNCLTAETCKPLINERTRAIIVVHLGGWITEMDDLMKLAQDRGLYVIEDCAQSHGATYKGRMGGSIGHFNAFSFCQDKIITTGGEGGMVTTNDSALWRKAWEYKDHGKSWDACFNRQHPPGFRWLHESFGTNWRLTEMQAAIGRVALRKLPRWTEQRRANAQRLNELFASEPTLFRVTLPPDHMEHAYYKYLVFVRPENWPSHWSRDKFVDAVNAVGIPCFQGFCAEIYREKAFTDLGWAPAQRLPIAAELADTTIMLLVHHTITHSDMDAIVTAISKVMAAVKANHPSVA